jgi:tryptophan synthase alpha chain
VERVRRFTQLPVAVGFGISKPEQVRAIWEIADGAVVGSAIVSEMEKIGNSGELPSRISQFCRSLCGLES